MTLNALQFNVTMIHGGMAQQDREQKLDEFLRGLFRICVTSNVSARGIDFPDIDYVINFDLPQDAKDYTHRAGRTGRAGKQGTVITFVCQDNITDYLKLEKKLKRKLDQRKTPLTVDDELKQKVMDANEVAIKNYKRLSEQLRSTS